MTITNRADDYAYQLKDRLEKEGMRVSVDDRNEKIGFKIREAQVQKVPYMLVLGDKEVAEGLVSVRSRRDGDLGSMTLDAFAKATGTNDKELYLVPGATHISTYHVPEYVGLEVAKLKEFIGKHQ